MCVCVCVCVCVSVSLDVTIKRYQKWKYVLNYLLFKIRVDIKCYQYIHTQYTCIHIYIYIYIYIEREREREKGLHMFLCAYVVHSLSLSLSLSRYIYIYIERERENGLHMYLCACVTGKFTSIVNWNTMTRKSDKHWVRYTEPLDSCFDLIWSHQQCIPWALPPGDRTSDHRMQSQNSTTESPVHVNVSLILYFW